MLCQIRSQLLNTSLSDVPDRHELISWIESITNPTKKTLEPWTPTRPMVDLLDLVQRFFWHPRMKGSNSMKVVLPAILETSSYLQETYSKPIYGTSGGIKSHNYANYTWIERDNGKVVDPYKLLPPVFDRWDRTLDRLYGDEELADGGAAIMAYAKMQFSEMSEEESRRIVTALLRYCELDTLAMVMLWEGWTNYEGE